MVDGLQILQAILLGLVQGLTEFLPISSSGHLLIMPWLFGWSENSFITSVQFDIALHVGTLFSVLTFFGRDFIRLGVAWLGSVRQMLVPSRAQGIVANARSAPTFQDDARLAWLILLGTLPAGIVGLLFERKIDEVFHSKSNFQTAMVLIAVAQIIFATLLLLVDRVSTKQRSSAELNWKDGILIGLAQAVALFPGVSRSGITMTIGLARGLDRYTATRFSFLLSSPIIIVAGLKGIYDLSRNPIQSQDMLALLAGVLVAAVTGFICVGWLLRMISRIGMRGFVIYRYCIAAVILIKVFTGI